MRGVPQSQESFHESLRKNITGKIRFHNRVRSVHLKIYTGGPQLRSIAYPIPQEIARSIPISIPISIFDHPGPCGSGRLARSPLEGTPHIPWKTKIQTYLCHND